MGKKYKDRNGFLHLEGMPISRVQVAPYLGRQIDASGRAGLEKNRIYGVYRSAEELFKPSVMKGFDGMPFRVGHQMIGEGAASADRTAFDGCFLNVRRGRKDDEVNKGDPRDYLFADIVIYTDRAQKAIANGTRQFSMGYRCTYVPKEGTYGGEDYEFVQTNITANHLALVPHGRAGSSVCVMDEAILTEDGLVITCDSLPEEIQIMKEDENEAKGKLVELLKGSNENVQDCLDYCDLTPEQKKAIKSIKGEKKPTEGKAEDARCKGCKAKDELPPEPPPAEAEEEKKEDAPAPETESAPKEEKPEPAPVPEKPEPAPAPKEEKPAEVPAGDSAPGRKEMFTKDELDEACKKARKEGRKDALRAKALAEAVNEDAEDLSEADVARKACKKIKGLEQYAQDSVSDARVLDAVRGYLAHKAACDEDFDVPPAKGKKKILTAAQDEAIAKAPRFSTVTLTQYLGGK